MIKEHIKIDLPHGAELSCDLSKEKIAG